MRRPRFYQPDQGEKKNLHKICSMAAANLKLCDKQRGYTPLLLTKFQACSCDILHFFDQFENLKKKKLNL